MLIALHYAERLSFPAVMAPLFPLFNPTAAYPAPGVPPVRLGRRSTAVYNRASHCALRRTVSLASRWLFAPWRKSVGLPRLPMFADVLRRGDGATAVEFIERTEKSGAASRTSLRKNRQDSPKKPPQKNPAIDQVPERIEAACGA